jgi:HAD superfamily phosphatase (TIGR01668 family)
MIIDLDNTLVAWGAEEIPHRLKEWVGALQNNSFKLCLVSNARASRARRMGEDLGLPVVTPALKPAHRPFKRGLQCLGLSAEEVAVVGDQIFTDVLGGNRMGLFTILVDPISQSEFLGTRVVRRIEKLFGFRGMFADRKRRGKS